MKTYKTLYELVQEELKKVKGKGGASSIITPSPKLSDNERLISEYMSSIAETNARALKNRIIEGLEIRATEPASNSVIITPGIGILKGKEVRLLNEKTITIVFPENKSLVYLHLDFNENIIQKTEKDESMLVIGKIVCVPGKSNVVYDTYDEAKKDGYGAYIVSAKDLLFDNEVSIDDDTIQALRNNMSKLFADNLIGNIRLSENLKITNTFGTLYMDSQSLKFYNKNGEELARYTAIDARIGNIVIEPNRLRSRNFVSGKSGFQIKDTGDVEFNDIVARGTIYASSGSIGGIEIGESSLKSSNYVFEESGFILESNGNAEFNDITIRGTIYASVGKIGGWTIGENSLYTDNLIIDSLNERINLADKIYIDGAGRFISSVPFQSGNVGWRIDEDSAEFNNAIIRGSLRAASFTKDEIHATNGTLLITSALIVAEQFTTPSTIDTDFNIICKDPETGPAQVFNAGDIIRCKTVYNQGINDVWATVVSYTDNGNGTGTYTVTLKSGTNVTIPAGTTIVSYGQSTDNKILITSDMDNSPYIDIFNTGDAPWNGVTTKLRLGNLNNFSDPDFGTLTGFGLFADNVYLKGHIIISGGSGISNLSDANLDNIADGETYKRTTANEKTGAGYAYNALDSSYSLVTRVLPGSNIGTPGGSGLYLGADYLGYYDGTEWKVYIDSSGKFTFKGDSNNYISWDGTLLSVKGDITVTGGSGITNFSDAGAVVTANNLDDIADGTTYKRVTQNEKTGAGYAYNALNSDYSLKTKVLPGDNVGTPGGSGLFLGADYLGYYDGTEWKVFIDKNGNFTFKGNDNNSLSWDGSVLRLKGEMVAGKIYSSDNYVTLDLNTERYLKFCKSDASGSNKTKYLRVGVDKELAGGETRLTIDFKNDSSDDIIEISEDGIHLKGYSSDYNLLVESFFMCDRIDLRRWVSGNENSVLIWVYNGNLEIKQSANSQSIGCQLNFDDEIDIISGYIAKLQGGSGYISVSSLNVYVSCPTEFSSNVIIDGSLGIGIGPGDFKLHVNGRLRIDDTTDSTSRTLQTYLPINVNGTTYYLALYQ